MTWTQTLILLGAAVLLAAFCGWRGARPPDFRKGPRMMPWRFLMLLCAGGAFYLLLHMAEMAKAAR
jgi:drug/metabolite transporter (DMT)-like permease